jgi:hypothetical protein
MTPGDETSQYRRCAHRERENEMVPNSMITDVISFNLLEFIASGLWIVSFSNKRRGIADALPSKLDAQNASPRFTQILGAPLGRDKVAHQASDR